MARHAETEFASKDAFQLQVGTRCTECGHFCTVDFATKFYTHQLFVNDDTRDTLHSSNNEKCRNARKMLNCVNIDCENATAKFTFVLHYTQPMY